MESQAFPQKYPRKRWVSGVRGTCTWFSAAMAPFSGSSENRPRIVITSVRLGQGGRSIFSLQTFEDRGMSKAGV